MGDFFKGGTNNPWVEKDRQDQRNLVLTAVLFVVAVLAGIGLLIFAFVNG